MVAPGDASHARSKTAAILIYTLLRVGLFAVVWVVVDLLTPFRGVWAAVVAILISGAISIIVLDRQRSAVGAVAAGYFGRINARIEASARAEDGSGEPEDDAEQKSVDQQ